MKITFNADGIYYHLLKNSEEFDALMADKQAVYRNKNLHRIGTCWWSSPDNTDYPCLVILDDPIYNGDHEYFPMTILPNCTIIEE